MNQAHDREVGSAVERRLLQGNAVSALIASKSEPQGWTPESQGCRRGRA